MAERDATSDEGGGEVKILVTGGTGFLGNEVVRGLAAAGHSIRIISRGSPGRWPDGVEVVRGDLADRDSVRQATAGVQALYHLAGLVSFDPKDSRRMYDLHVECTRHLLAEAAEANVQRIVLASTSGTISVSKQERTGTETDDYPIAVVGRWPYYLSKIYEEKLALGFCRERAIPLIVLNPSLFLGPGDNRLSSTWIVSKFLNREIPAMPSGGLSFVDVRDAASAFVAALTRGEVHGRHLMGVNMGFSEFFGRLNRLTGVPVPRLRLPSSVNVLGAQLLERWAKARGTEAPIDHHSVDIGEHFFYLDASKSERLLGFRARDPQDTIYDTVQYLLSKMPPDSVPGVKGKLRELRTPR